MNTEQVSECLTRWMQTLCTRNPLAMTNLYAANSILVPTFSGIKDTRQGIFNYFVEFTSREGLCGEFDKILIQPAPPYAIASGLYTFGWSENGHPQQAQARFTYVFDPYGEILNHHSSGVP